MTYLKKAILLFLILLVSNGCQPPSEKPPGQSLRANLIFPLQAEHVHGSTLVELPNGDLLSAWFQGSGERWADDVRIMGSRLIKGDTTWSTPFVMADEPGFPDINPILFMDKQQRLWLMWYTVLANQWETSLLMYARSENYDQPGVPQWKTQNVLLVKAGDKTERGIQPNDKFVMQVEDQLRQYEDYMKTTLLPQAPDSLKPRLVADWKVYRQKMDSLSTGRNMLRSGRITDDAHDTSAKLGYPLTRRLGWQTKNKAVYAGHRLILPLYSDGFDGSLFAVSDDNGEHWQFSNPVLGGVGIQPTIAIEKDSTLVAYLRDNGPPPQRTQRTMSHDKGMTWSIAKDDILPNPGAGFDMVTLPNGEWLMVFNDTEVERFNLSVAISDDEGKTWRWKRSLENDTRTKDATSSHYPSVIVGADGIIHVVYSYHRDDVEPGKTIKYASFPVAWVKEAIKSH
jgi:predicted neuraminidase